LKFGTNLGAAHPALRGLTAEGVPDPSKIKTFLESHSFPLADRGASTFVFHGDAERVGLCHWIEGLTGDPSFRRLSNTKLWFLVLELPEGSRIEYKVAVTRNGEAQVVRDPLNPLVARDPFGANSVCRAYGYTEPDWSRTHSIVPRGTLQERAMQSRHLPGRRRWTLYRPAGFQGLRPYPLLILHDGHDHLRYADLGAVLDNLIHRGEIPPLVAALIDPGERLEEYTGSKAHSDHLVEELVPRIERELPLVSAPEGRILAGASLGAVASLHAAARSPGFFGGLLLQSGSFVYSENEGRSRGPHFDAVAAFIDRFRSTPIRAVDRVFLSCGGYEPLVHENRAMLPVLQEAGMEVRYVESRDGHNWQNWRDRLQEGLSWLFPNQASLRAESSSAEEGR
jgi:enterochelin esterase-like enzyme